MSILRIMGGRTLLLLFCVVSLFFVGCNTQDWPEGDEMVTTPDADQEERGSIAIRLCGSSQRATTTTITKEEADLFLVTVYKGDEAVSQHVQLGTIGTLTFPAGNGYKVDVENITASDAETLNDGWGAKRFTGRSKSFGVQAGQTTAVSVSCSVANAAVNIAIDAAVEGCTVTVSDGVRTLSTSENRVAYFNITDGSHPVTLRIEKDGVVVSEQTLDLEAAQVKDVNIGASVDPETGAINVEITYDESFVVVSEDIIITE